MCELKVFGFGLWVRRVRGKCGSWELILFKACNDRHTHRHKQTHRRIHTPITCVTEVFFLVFGFFSFLVCERVSLSSLSYHCDALGQSLTKATLACGGNGFVKSRHFVGVFCVRVVCNSGSVKKKFKNRSIYLIYLSINCHAPPAAHVCPAPLMILSVYSVRCLKKIERHTDYVTLIYSFTHTMLKLVCVLLCLSPTSLSYSNYYGVSEMHLLAPPMRATQAPRLIRRDVYVSREGDVEPG